MVTCCCIHSRIEKKNWYSNAVCFTSMLGLIIFAALAYFQFEINDLKVLTLIYETETVTEKDDFLNQFYYSLIATWAIASLFISLWACQIYSFRSKGCVCFFQILLIILFIVFLVIGAISLCLGMFGRKYFNDACIVASNQDDSQLISRVEQVWLIPFLKVFLGDIGQLFVDIDTSMDTMVNSHMCS